MLYSKYTQKMHSFLLHNAVSQNFLYNLDLVTL